MKQLTQWIKRLFQKKPHIPPKVMEQIVSVEKLNIIYHSEIRDRRNWNFKELIDEYIHKNICWKVGIANGNEAVSPIDKESAKCKKDNILLQRVLWGSDVDTHYYGTMSFIKFKKKWYYVSSKVIQPLSKLPSFDDCYAQFTAEDNKKRNAVWSDMKELFFEYAAEEWSRHAVSTKQGVLSKKEIF